MSRIPPITAIIVDDESKARENLIYLLGRYCPQVSVVGEAWDEESITAVLLENKVDLIFLDIQIGNTSIFDIINYDMLQNSYVIFISAHDKFKDQSLDYGGLDYLLKPIDPKKLKSVFKKNLSLFS